MKSLFRQFQCDRAAQGCVSRRMGDGLASRFAQLRHSEEVETTGTAQHHARNKVCPGFEGCRRHQRYFSIVVAFSCNSTRQDGDVGSVSMRGVIA